MLACSLALPLAGIALSACSDDGGGTSPDASARPDATPAPDATPGPDAAPPDATPMPDTTITSVAGGVMTKFEAAATFDVFGAAQLVRMAEATRVELYVEHGGLLTAGTEYIAHVHALPCGVEEGGGHYKLDPTVTDTEENNEIWVRVTPDDTVAEGSHTVYFHAARLDAQSIVLHDTDGTKLICADLKIDDAGDAQVDLEGSFAAFAAANTDDMSIAGTVTVSVFGADGDNKTDIVYDISGLQDTETYEAHVHQFPCAIGDAGAHYQRDPAITAVQEDNELWLFSGAAPTSGALSDTATFAGVLARGDGLSVVIHRIDGTELPKVACADLTRTTAYPEFVTEGNAGELAGAPAGYQQLDATVTLERKQDGTTVVTLDVTGLPNGVQVETTYPARVHAATCATNPPGGAHYLRDPAGAAGDENNEIWLDLVVPGGTRTGTATVTADMHTARPQAISVVIHDATDPTIRVACIDLE
ncbi:hypothetical protein [Haliangium sp.]|uniref:hypothetical protein n=1 Tax=Haliangium sp. TaxID=2663208 RepID=UPI003D10E65F